MRTTGGYLFACPPDLPSETAPALWDPALAAATVVLDDAPPEHADARPIDIAALGRVLADQQTSSGRHLIVADEDGDHRVWLRSRRPDQRLAFVIPSDSRFRLRVAVAERFERRMRGVSGGPLPPGCRPTPFQRHRLVMLLRLLDADEVKASRREMASVVVYPGMRLSGATWKGSAERRRTQRMLDEARQLMTKGYRRLINGG